MARNGKIAIVVRFDRFNPPARNQSGTGPCTWLAGGEEGLDQLDGMTVFGEIPHRAMATRIEESVEVFLLDTVDANGLVELSLRSRVLLEPARQVGTEFRRGRKVGDPCRSPRRWQAAADQRLVSDHKLWRIAHLTSGLDR
jgi:hypothetical protein